MPRRKKITKKYDSIDDVSLQEILEVLIEVMQDKGHRERVRAAIELLHYKQPPTQVLAVDDVSKNIRKGLFVSKFEMTPEEKNELRNKSAKIEDDLQTIDGSDASVVAN